MQLTIKNIGYDLWDIISELSKLYFTDPNDENLHVWFHCWPIWDVILITFLKESIQNPVFLHNINKYVFVGGLLICLPREQAAAYCKDIEKQEGYQAWIIGIVEKGNRTARIIDKPRVIEVPATDKEGQLW